MEKTPRLRRSPCIAALLVSVACSGEPDRRPQGPVTDDTYVAVMVDLLLLDSEPLRRPTPEEQAAAADSIRIAILDSHGVSAADILAFASAEGGFPGRMQVLWERITREYDSARVARLQDETEARSESDGKLGADARQVAGNDSTAGVADSAAGPSRELSLPARMDSLRRQFRGKRSPDGTPD